MLKKYFLIFFLPIILYAQKKQDKKFITPQTQTGLRFTQNSGQWDDNVRYKVMLNCGNIFFEDNVLTYFLYDHEKFKTYHLGGAGKYSDKSIRGHAYKVNFLNSNLNSANLNVGKMPYYENFYLGNDPKKWKSNVNSYKKITYVDLYDGIDYEAVCEDGFLKYNYYIKPGSDYKKIQMEYKGVNDLEIVEGELVISTSFAKVKEKKPYAYQKIKDQLIPIPCRYKVNGNKVSFEILANYDKTQVLIIDPTLVFAAQSGSTADNFGMTATYDIQGNLYSGGTVFDVGYPVTPGAYSNIFNGPAANGNTDVVLTKYNSNGTGLVFSTYLGGNRSEIVTSLIVDANNNLCLYGATGSANFPTTVGAYDATFNGGSYLDFYFNGTTFLNGTDIYVSKFNSSGTSLLGSTFIGGSGNDGVNHTNGLPTYTLAVTQSIVPLGSPPGSPCVLISGNYTLTEHKADSLQYNYGDQYRGEIQLDKFGNIYIASSSRSSDFPAVSAFDNSLGGLQDAVVVKFNSALTGVVWSNYLGGSNNDAGYGLVVTDSLYTYVTGGTASSNFPTTPGCYLPGVQGGKADGYIIKINPAGNSILKGTYIGTNNYDQTYFIQKDKKNMYYVYGQSLGNMPVIPSGTLALYSNPGTHQFITRLDCQLNNVNMSTVFGSSASLIDISPSAFSVDNCGNIYLSGWGGNIIYGPSISGMPTTTNAAYPSSPNGYDFYLMALGPDATSMLYGSYFGGTCSMEHVDGGTSRFDPKGKIYQSVCAGCGNNDDFPVTPGSWPNTPGNPNHANNCNNGVFKFDFNLQIAVSTINTNTISGCLPLTVSFTNATPGSAFIWYFGNGQTNSVSANPIVTYTNPGNYTVSLVVTDPGSCNLKDSSVTFITVYPGPTSAFTASIIPCTNTVTFINNSSGSLTPTPYTWNLGDGSPTLSVTTPPPYTYTSTGTFTITLLTTAANGCMAVAVQTVSVFNFTPNVTSGTICSGQNTNITAGGGTSYTWSPPTGLSNSNIASPVANPTTTTIYTVQIDNNIPGYVCSKTLTTQLTVYPKPNAAFGTTMNPCGGGVSFFDGSAANIASWQWTLSPTATSTVQNPYNFYGNGGTHTVTLIVTNTDGCKDTMDQVLVIAVPPPLSISPGTVICLGTKAQLSASGGVSYQWTPAASLDIPNIANPSASPTISTQYSVTITSASGCVFLLTTNVTVSQPPSANPSAQANPSFVITGNSTTLIYLGAPGSNISWLPVGTTTPATGYTVTASPNKPTTYTAIATNGACSEKATVLVEAYTEGCIEKDVFVPNTFTPNGDGQNDILFVRGLKINDIYFAVYNRWGELVFETNDKTKGWDGIYKTRPADVGVFGWYLKVKCFNGEETFRKGNVTLIR